MFITSDERKSDFIGKLALLGQGGSGKTFMINTIANYLAERQIYNWDEESNMAGTIAVTPYILDFPDKRRVIINDNPGQDSLEFIRKIIASQGDVYQGLIVVVDAIGWNFRNVGILQAKSLVEFNKNLNLLPLSIIISKRDLLDHLLKSNKIPVLATVMANAIKNLGSDLEVSYQSRMYKKNLSKQITLENPSLIPLTAMEQVLTNAMDEYLKKDPITDFTKMNVRLFVRSFLLGYCEAMRTMLDLSKYPFFASISDPSLVNRLNYHRPTAYETGSGWEKLGKSSQTDNKVLAEPYVLRQTFDSKTIETIITNYVFASEHKIKEFLEQIESIGKEKWQIVSSCFTSSIERKGKEQIKETLIKLLDVVSEQKSKRPKTIKEDSISDFGLDEF